MTIWLHSAHELTDRHRAGSSNAGGPPHGRYFQPPRGGSHRCDCRRRIRRRGFVALDASPQGACAASNSACSAPIRPASAKQLGNRRLRQAVAPPVRDQCRERSVDILDVRNPKRRRASSGSTCGARLAEQRRDPRRSRCGRDRGAGENRSGPRRVLHHEWRADHAGARGRAAGHAHVHARRRVRAGRERRRAERLRRRADVDPEGSVSIIRVPPGKGDWKRFGRPTCAASLLTVQRPGSEPARAGHSHLRSRRQRRAGFRAGVHRGLGGFAHGLRDAAGEQCDRGDRHHEGRGDEAAAARLQGLQRTAADDRDV